MLSDLQHVLRGKLQFCVSLAPFNRFALLLSPAKTLTVSRDIPCHAMPLLLMLSRRQWKQSKSREGRKERERVERQQSSATFLQMLRQMREQTAEERERNEGNPQTAHLDITFGQKKKAGKGTQKTTTSPVHSLSLHRSLSSLVSLLIPEAIFSFSSALTPLLVSRSLFRSLASLSLSPAPADRCSTNRFKSLHHLLRSHCLQAVTAASAAELSRQRREKGLTSSGAGSAGSVRASFVSRITSFRLLQSLGCALVNGDDRSKPEPASAAALVPGS